jgi:hypothetical protein
LAENLRTQAHNEANGRIVDDLQGNAPAAKPPHRLLVSSPDDLIPARSFGQRQRGGSAP